MIKEKIIREKIDGEWVVTIPEVVLKRLLEQSEEVKSQQAEIDSLSMAHDNMARELSLFKEKDKHELIKSNIALNKKVQELEKQNEKNYWIGNVIKLENLKLEEQNKRYRETLKGVLKILDSENWSKYDSSALQDNVHDYITLENGELLEESE